MAEIEYIKDLYENEGLSLREIARRTKKDPFSNWFKQNKVKYGLAYSDHIIDGQSKKARGYCGIKILK